MLEQFNKMWSVACKNNIGDENAITISKRIWKKCCEWVLEKAGENINLIEFMQKIANEAGVSVVITADGFGEPIGDVTKVPLEEVDLRDGMRDVYKDKCSNLQRKICMGTVEKVENEAKDCIHNLGLGDNGWKCTRGCRFIGDGCGPVWKMPADSHNSAGWIPCGDYEQTE